MAPATATIASECRRDHQAKHVNTKIWKRNTSFSFSHSRNFQLNRDKEEAWQGDRYFGAEITGAQEKTSRQKQRSARGSKVASGSSVRPFVGLPTPGREKEPRYNNCAHSKPCSEADRCRGNYCDILDSRVTFYNLTTNWKLLVGHSRNHPFTALLLWALKFLTEAALSLRETNWTF
jgi:hypothetical protein